MPFSNPAEFKSAIQAAIEKYQQDKKWVPRTFTSEEKLDAAWKKIKSLDDKTKILEELHKLYKTLLRKESTQLSLAVALLMAKELYVSEQWIEQYHSLRQKKDPSDYFNLYFYQLLGINNYQPQGRWCVGNMSMADIKEHEVIIRIGFLPNDQLIGVTGAVANFMGYVGENVWGIYLQDPVLIAYQCKTSAIAEEKSAASNFEEKLIKGKIFSTSSKGSSQSNGTWIYRANQMRLSLADLKEQFKTGVPLLQPDPARLKSRELQVIEQQQSTRSAEVPLAKLAAQRLSNQVLNPERGQTPTNQGLTPPVENPANTKGQTAPIPNP